MVLEGCRVRGCLREAFEGTEGPFFVGHCKEEWKQAPQRYERFLQGNHAIHDSALGHGKNAISS